MAIYKLTDKANTTPIIHHISNDVVIQATGTFNSGTVKLNYSQDGLDFIALDDFAITKDDVLAVSPADSSNFKISLDGASSGASVSVSVILRRG